MSPVFQKLISGSGGAEGEPPDTTQSTKIISGTNGGYRKIGFSQSA
jgi:hypothetical protein